MASTTSAGTPSARASTATSGLCACAARWMRCVAPSMNACGHLSQAIWRSPARMERSWPGNRPGCAGCHWCREPRWKPSMPRWPRAIRCMTRCPGPRRASTTG
ncbi:hypothetical protein G6F22_013974 [Rhizopus arrhizus]|nr:hypothetical protein G6F22_013974 [Rhizopus arrhizus]